VDLAGGTAAPLKRARRTRRPGPAAPIELAPSPIADDLIAVGRALTSEALEGAAEGPPVLYHYTTGQGLVGIMGGEQVALWASRVLSLNDVLEVQHGLALARELFQERPQGRRGGRLEARFTEAVVASFPSEPGHVGKIVWDTYVMSFSEDDDLLPQWVHYSDRGGGYSIGFDRTRLPVALPPDTPSFAHLGPVIYDVKRQRRLLSAMMTRFLSRLRRERRVDDAALATAAEILWINVTNLCVCFKAPDHRVEREWRLFFFTFFEDEAPDGWGAGDVRNMRFRSIADRIVPYFVLNLAPVDGRSPIASVRLGPSVDVAAAAPAVRLLLRRVHAAEKEPRRSRLILRR
jgi:hypothetical protein